MKKLMLIAMLLLAMCTYAQEEYLIVDEDYENVDLDYVIAIGPEEGGIVDIIDLGGVVSTYYSIPWESTNKTWGQYYNYMSGNEQQMEIFGPFWYTQSNTYCYNGYMYNSEIPHMRINKKHPCYDRKLKKYIKKGYLIILEDVE